MLKELNKFGKLPYVRYVDDVLLEELDLNEGEVEGEFIDDILNGSEGEGVLDEGDGEGVVLTEAECYVVIEGEGDVVNKGEDDVLNDREGDVLHDGN